MRKIVKFLLVMVAADVARYGVTRLLKHQVVKVETARQQAQEAA